MISLPFDFIDRLLPRSSVWSYVLWTSAVVYGIHIFEILTKKLTVRKKEEEKRTLYLRDVKTSPGKMVGGNETQNIFTHDLYIYYDTMVPSLDFGLFKVLDGNLPILAKQEYLHGMMHTKGASEFKEQGESGKKWRMFAYVSRFLMSSCGRQIACGLLGFMEAALEPTFYLSNISPFTKGWMNNELAFHLFEEHEHGALAVSYLRTKVWTLTPLLLFPLGVIMNFLFFVFPPVMTLACNPNLLLKANTYKDLVLFYLTFIPVYIASLFIGFLFWVLPFHEPRKANMERGSYWENHVKARGIRFDIVDKETYSLLF